MSTVTSSPPPRNRKPARFDLLEKLFARALHPATPNPEAENAGAKIIRVARADRLSVTDIAQAFAPALPTPIAEPRPAACDIAMPRGRYVGESLGSIAEHDLRYLGWVAREWDDIDLRDAADAVLTYFTGRDAND